MTAVAAGSVRVSPGWLALREPADAVARAGDLVDLLLGDLPAGDRAVIHDLGCGTGSMGRWLAPRLPGRQHWVLYDRDGDLLSLAVAGTPTTTAGGARVTVEGRRRDITRLAPNELAGASLITASALLDMLTADELGRFVASCAGPGCPVLVTLSVIGRVELHPAHPLDEPIGRAFNAHQRRPVDGRRLLGPDAVALAADAFRGHGCRVELRPSTWRLGVDHAALTGQWLAGWLQAALEQEPGLVAATTGYRRQRAAQAAAGGLRVTVAHQDLLARPRSERESRSEREPR